VGRTKRTIDRRSLLGVVLQIGVTAAVARADDFSRLLGPPLFEIARPSAGTGRIGLRAIESLPEVVRGERSALIVVTTDLGNVAKLLVSPGLRKPAVGGSRTAMVPVLNIDRY
jgi:hypothetical protein